MTRWVKKTPIGPRLHVVLHAVILYFVYAEPGIASRAAVRSRVCGPRQLHHGQPNFRVRLRVRQAAPVCARESESRTARRRRPHPMTDCIVRVPLDSDGFVDLPASFSSELDMLRASVERVQDEDGRSDGVLLRGHLLHHAEGMSLYSCGGLLLRFPEAAPPSGGDDGDNSFFVRSKCSPEESVRRSKRARRPAGTLVSE